MNSLSLLGQAVLRRTRPFILVGQAQTRTELLQRRPFCLTGRRLEAEAEKPPKLERPASLNWGRQTEEPGQGKGPVSWMNLAVSGSILAFLTGVYFYAKNKKDNMLAMERQKEIGKTKIGGDFELVDHTGKTRTMADFRGKWVLLYFGFTHCPDICPDEMDKMALVVDNVAANLKKLKNDREIVPLFITVDPDRDGVAEVAEYIKEFHPRMVGLTGSVDKVKDACKAFRVYFSAGPRDEEEDYIVDHTIIIYMIDPDGQFLDYFGQTKDADQITAAVMMEVGKYDSAMKKSLFGRG